MLPHVVSYTIAFLMALTAAKLVGFPCKCPAASLLLRCLSAMLLLLLPHAAAIPTTL